MFRIYPYKSGSSSAKRLRDALEGKLIKLSNSLYRPQPNHFILNWGNSTRQANLEGVEILNPPENVAIAANKLATLQRLKESGVSHVEFTTDWETASDWDAKTFVRHKLSGHSGDGIEVFGGTRALPRAPLYTKAVDNYGEYRVHVFDQTVIHYQKKSRRVDDDGNVITAEGEEADVRNLKSNWVYRTGNLKRLERIENLAIDAIAALGLDYGAVDIIKDENGDVYVLEVNTAPGLLNDETLMAYVNAFKTLT